MILEGTEKTKIAKELNIARSWLYKIIGKPEFKAELEARRAHVRKAARDKITGRVNKCLDNILDLADNSTDMRVKYNANKYIVDQVIGTPIGFKEDIIVSSDNPDKDTNTLKQEIADLKLIK